MRARLGLMALVLTLMATTLGVGEAAAGSPRGPARQPGHSQQSVSRGLPAWGSEPVPQAGSGRSGLRAVSVLSADEAWAVGSTGIDYDPEAEPLVERWDGAAWSTVDVPAVAGAALYGVVEVAPDDVWMVGSFNTSREALVLHWNGTAVEQVQHPNPGANRNDLYAVTATGPKDVWAVGSKTSGVSDPLTLHWNGTRWREVTAPGSSSYDELRGVTAVAMDDVWAVGVLNYQASALHWNGKRWLEVDVPVPGISSSLSAVSAGAANEVWAVGQDSEGTLSARWDGRRWVVVDTPDSGGFLRDDLRGVAVVGRGDVWAVGVSYPTRRKSVALHFGGSTWERVTTPDPPQSDHELDAISASPGGNLFAAGSLNRRASVLRLAGGSFESLPVEQVGTDSNQLLGISAAAPDDIWAVGALGEFNPEALTLHYDGVKWKRVKAPSPPTGTKLNDVVALQSDDAWAVGQTKPDDLGTAVALHWDGTRWRSTAVPQPGGQYASPRLLAVAALGTDDVWAVGQYDVTARPRTMLVHWDGARWRLADTGRCDPFGGLAGITFLAADDGWAVGQASICHWNGRRWTLVASPQPRPAYSEINYPLEDVSGAASDDVWAVGTVVYEIQDYVEFGSFTEHWDGSTWQRVANPSGAGLNGVEAVAPDDVWAVGRDDFGPIIVRWNGRAWADVPTPDRENGVELEGVTATGNQLWDAGRSAGDDTFRSLVQRAPSPTEGAVLGSSNIGHATVSWTGPETGSVETAPTGDFQVGGLLAGRYRFTLNYAGCPPLTKRHDIVAGRTGELDLVVDCG